MSRTTARTTDRDPRGSSVGRQDSILSLVPTGMTWKWVRGSVAGMRDDNNIRDNMMDGWAPVDGAKYPTLLHPLFANEERKDTVIWHGTDILMERPIELTEQAEFENAQESAAAMAAVDSDRREVSVGGKPTVIPIRDEGGPAKWSGRMKE